MKIAVIGAGIGGLTLAAAIRHFNPQAEVELFERDPENDSRFQGYSLGIKGDAGIPVLRQLGLLDQLRPEMVPIVNFIFCDQKGRPLLELPGGSDEKRQTLRVKRSRLKEALRSAAPEVKINLGMEGTGYQQAGDRVDVTFRDGQTVSADYVVAADGVGSALRQQMIGDRKHYLGLTTIVGRASIELQHPLLSGGYCLTLGDSGSSVFCYRQPDGITFSFTQHVEREDTLAKEAPEALLRRIQTATASWHKPVPQIAAAIDPASLVVRGYYDKEPARRVRDGRVWLIGDAAHPMSPFQGQGANMAMLDALRLGDLLATSAAPGSDVGEKPSKLEADIVARGRKAVLASRSAARQFHTTNRFQQTTRNLGFRMATVFIKGFARRGG